MSFSIGRKNEVNRGVAIARIKGSDDNGKYLYLKTYKRNIKDLPKKITERYTDEEYEILDDAIKTGLEPQDEKAQEEYYKLLDEFEIMKHKGFILKNGGKLMPLLNFNRNERLYVTGSSGSGKTYFSTELIKQYLKHYKNNNLIIISGVDVNEDLQDLEPSIIDPVDLVQEPLRDDEIRDSIILFDDVLSIPNKLVRNNIIAVINNLMETNRHTNTTLIIINHLINDFHNTRKILNESSSITFFPKSSAKNNIKKYLKTYEGLNDKLIRKIVNLPSRAVSLYKGSELGEYILYERGCFMI